MKKSLIILISSVLAILALVLFYSPTKAAVGRIMYSLRWTNGLVGYWSFDGKDMNWAVASSTIDRSGQGNNGATVGMATSTAPAEGIIGQALKFDGSNDYVDVPHNVSLNSSDITISFWYYNQGHTSSRFPLAKGGGWSNPGYAVVIEQDETIRWIIGRTAGETILDTPEVLAENQWSYLTFTLQNLVLEVYINAVASAGSATAPSYETSTLDLYIAAPRALQAGYFDNGIIDEVRVYNRALTANEIKYHYDRTAPQFRSAVKSTNDNGLVGYWNFDSCDTCTTVIDNGGKGNNGAISDVNASGLATRVAGKVNNALKFDGVDDYVSTGNAGSGIKTVSFWMKADDLVNKKIIDIDGTDQIEIISSNITATSFPAATVYVDGVVSSAMASGWHYVTITDTTGVNASAMDIGRVSTSYYNGLIDEVRVYNRALSAEEIKASYESQKGKFVVNASQNDKWKNGLVGFWSFNGQDMSWGANQALDRSGQGNPGTLTNMSTTTSPVEGIVGQALKFDGVNDYVDFGDVNTITGSFSIEAWIYVKSFPSVTVLISRNENSPWYHNYYLELSSNKLKIGFWNGSSWQALTDDTTSLVANTWYHAVGKYDNSTGFAKLFLNGNEIKSGSLTGSPVSGASNKLLIGSGNAGTAYFFNGLIDEVRIYNRALTAAEILEQYRANRR